MPFSRWSVLPEKMISTRPISVQTPHWSDRDRIITNLQQRNG
jgi:hypothetical protein